MASQRQCHQSLYTFIVLAWFSCTVRKCQAQPWSSYWLSNPHDDRAMVVQKEGTIKQTSGEQVSLTDTGVYTHKSREANFKGTYRIAPDRHQRVSSSWPEMADYDEADWGGAKQAETLALTLEKSRLLKEVLSESDQSRKQRERGRSDGNWHHIPPQTIILPVVIKRSFPRQFTDQGLQFGQSSHQYKENTESVDTQTTRGSRDRNSVSSIDNQYQYIYPEALDKIDRRNSTFVSNPDRRFNQQSSFLPLIGDKTLTLPYLPNEEGKSAPVSASIGYDRAVESLTTEKTTSSQYLTDSNSPEVLNQSPDQRYDSGIHDRLDHDITLELNRRFQRIRNTENEPNADYQPDASSPETEGQHRQTVDKPSISEINQFLWFKRNVPNDFVRYIPALESFNINSESKFSPTTPLEFQINKQQSNLEFFNNQPKAIHPLFNQKSNNYSRTDPWISYRTNLERGQEHYNRQEQAKLRADPWTSLTKETNRDNNGIRPDIKGKEDFAIDSVERTLETNSESVLTSESNQSQEKLINIPTRQINNQQRQNYDWDLETKSVQSYDQTEQQGGSDLQRIERPRLYTHTRLSSNQKLQQDPWINRQGSNLDPVFSQDTGSNLFTDPWTSQIEIQRNSLIRNDQDPTLIQTDDSQALRLDKDITPERFFSNEEEDPPRRQQSNDYQDDSSDELQFRRIRDIGVALPFESNPLNAKTSPDNEQLKKSYTNGFNSRGENPVDAQETSAQKNYNPIRSTKLDPLTTHAQQERLHILTPSSRRLRRSAHHFKMGKKLEAEDKNEKTSAKPHLRERNMTDTYTEDTVPVSPSILNIDSSYEKEENQNSGNKIKQDILTEISNSRPYSDPNSTIAEGILSEKKAQNKSRKYIQDKIVHDNGSLVNSSSDLHMVDSDKHANNTPKITDKLVESDKVSSRTGFFGNVSTAVVTAVAYKAKQTDSSLNVSPFGPEGVLRKLAPTEVSPKFTTAESQSPFRPSNKNVWLQYNPFAVQKKVSTKTLHYYNIHKKYEKAIHDKTEGHLFPKAVEHTQQEKRQAHLPDTGTLHLRTGNISKYVLKSKESLTNTPKYTVRQKRQVDMHYRPNDSLVQTSKENVEPVAVKPDIVHGNAPTERFLQNRRINHQLKHATQTVKENAGLSVRTAERISRTSPENPFINSESHKKQIVLKNNSTSVPENPSSHFSKKFSSPLKQSNETNDAVNVTVNTLADAPLSRELTARQTFADNTNVYHGFSGERAALSEGMEQKTKFNPHEDRQDSKDWDHKGTLLATISAKERYYQRTADPAAKIQDKENIAIIAPKVPLTRTASLVDKSWSRYSSPRSYTDITHSDSSQDDRSTSYDQIQAVKSQPSWSARGNLDDGYSSGRGTNIPTRSSRIRKDRGSQGSLTERGSPGGYRSNVHTSTNQEEYNYNINSGPFKGPGQQYQTSFGNYENNQNFNPNQYGKSSYNPNANAYHRSGTESRSINNSGRPYYSLDNQQSSPSYGSGTSKVTGGPSQHYNTGYQQFNPVSENSGRQYDREYPDNYQSLQKNNQGYQQFNPGPGNIGYPNNAGYTQQPYSKSYKTQYFPGTSGNIGNKGNFYGSYQHPNNAGYNQYNPQGSYNGFSGQQPYYGSTGQGYYVHSNQQYNNHNSGIYLQPQLKYSEAYSVNQNKPFVPSGFHHTGTGYHHPGNMGIGYHHPGNVGTGYVHPHHIMQSDMGQGQQGQLYVGHFVDGAIKGTSSLNGMQILNGLSALIQITNTTGSSATTGNGASYLQYDPTQDQVALVSGSGSSSSLTGQGSHFLYNPSTGLLELVTTNSNIFNTNNNNNLQTAYFEYNPNTKQLTLKHHNVTTTSSGLHPLQGLQPIKLVISNTGSTGRMDMGHTMMNSGHSMMNSGHLMLGPGHHMGVGSGTAQIVGWVVIDDGSANYLMPNAGGYIQFDPTGKMNDGSEAVNHRKHNNIRTSGPLFLKHPSGVRGQEGRPFIRPDPDLFMRMFKEGELFMEGGTLVQNYYTRGDSLRMVQHFKSLPLEEVAAREGVLTGRLPDYHVTACRACGPDQQPLIEFVSAPDLAAAPGITRRFIYQPIADKEADGDDVAWTSGSSPLVGQSVLHSNVGTSPSSNLPKFGRPPFDN